MRVLVPDWLKSYKAKLVYKGILTVFALGLLYVPVHLLYSNVASASGAKDLPEKSAQLAGPIDEYYGEPLEVSPPDPSKIPNLPLISASPLKCSA